MSPQDERDEARQIVRDIYWMARRYADGRQSYAVGMFNDAVRKAYDAGWLEHRLDHEPRFARDSMFSPEWKSIEQRALDAETALAALRHPGAEYRRGVEDAARACDAEAARKSKACPTGSHSERTARNLATAIRLLPDTKGEGR
jgi:hypothetical protein